MQEGVCLDGCMYVFLCEIGLRTIKAVGRRANGNGGEVGRQTEENDEKVVVEHG